MQVPRHAEAALRVGHVGRVHRLCAQRAFGDLVRARVRVRVRVRLNLVRVSVRITNPNPNPKTSRSPGSGSSLHGGQLAPRPHLSRLFLVPLPPRCQMRYLVRVRVRVRIRVRVRVRVRVRIRVPDAVPRVARLREGGGVPGEG